MENPRWTWAETGGGIALIAFGAMVIYIASSYNFGTLRRMGPGFMPLVTGACIAALGVGIALRPEPANRAYVSRQRILAPVFVFASIAAWGLLVEPAGLIVATAALVLISAFAHPKPQMSRVAASLVLLPAMSVALFIWALRMPLSALPKGW